MKPSLQIEATVSARPSVDRPNKVAKRGRGVMSGEVTVRLGELVNPRTDLAYCFPV